MALNDRDVVAAAGVPVAREPSADATPQVAGGVVRAQPGFLAFKTESANRQCVVDVECGGDVGVGPGARMSGRNICALYLEDSDAFTPVESELCFVVAAAVALKGLAPCRLGIRLGPDIVLVEAPLASAPSENLVCRAGEVAVNPCFDAGVELADI